MRICKRIIEELQINARGEKPGRQQHIHNEHAQKSHSRTRGVANFGNVTRTEGAKHKKKWTAPRARTRFLCFATPLGRERQYYRKVYSRVGMAHNCFALFLCMDMRNVTARGLQSNACCVCLPWWKSSVSYERGWKNWNYERHARWEREFILCICSMGIRFLSLWTPSMDYYNF